MHAVHVVASAGNRSSEVRCIQPARRLVNDTTVLKELYLTHHTALVKLSAACELRARAAPCLVRIPNDQVNHGGAVTT